MADREDGDRRITEDAIDDAAEEKVLRAAPPVRPHHDHAGSAIARDLEDLARRIACAKQCRR
jgi:hypothetical protein